MAEELVPDVFERASRMVKGAAGAGRARGARDRFPSEYCTDRGRAINNFEPNWPETLTGFAKRAHEFFWRSSSRRYKVRAQIMDFPGGCRATSGSSSLVSCAQAVRERTRRTKTRARSPAGRLAVTDRRVQAATRAPNGAHRRCVAGPGLI